jgi:putative DNA primase/helicase
MLPAALEYAARGWAVFPCIPLTKEPAIKGGFKAATTNPETIKRLWSRPECNIGIATGAASGFWVFDVDGDEGEASLRALEAKYGPLPPTPTVISPRGGRHLDFKYTCPISNSVKKIARGLDVKGDGGYVLAPPSIFDDPKNNYKRGAYTWHRIGAPALAPDWLLELTRKPAPIKPTISQQAVATIRRAGSPGGAYGRAALERECAALAAMAPETGRNHALNTAAFRLAQLVAGGELDGSDVFESLLAASFRNQLVVDTGRLAVVATISSGFNAGLKNPRSRGTV